MTAEARARLLASLADQGVTEADYRNVEQARRLVDEVNAAVSGRGGGLVFAVTMLPTLPRATGAAAEEILETAERPEE